MYVPSSLSLTTLAILNKTSYLKIKLHSSTHIWWYMCRTIYSFRYVQNIAVASFDQGSQQIIHRLFFEKKQKEAFAGCREQR